VNLTLLNKQLISCFFFFEKILICKLASLIFIFFNIHGFKIIFIHRVKFPSKIYWTYHPSPRGYIYFCRFFLIFKLIIIEYLETRCKLYFFKFWFFLFKIIFFIYFYIVLMFYVKNYFLKIIYFILIYFKKNIWTAHNLKHVICVKSEPSPPKSTT
jgi:hypothetical protein